MYSLKIITGLASNQGNQKDQGRSCVQHSTTHLKEEFWGPMLNRVGRIGQSWWKALYSKDVLEKKAKRWESMEAEDAKQEFHWWLAGATFLQLGTFCK